MIPQLLIPKLLMPTSAPLSSMIYMLRLLRPLIRTLRTNLLSTQLPPGQHQMQMVKQKPIARLVQSNLHVIVVIQRAQMQKQTQECFLIFSNLLNENWKIYWNYKFFSNNQKTFKAQCTYVTDLLKADPLKDTTMEKKGLEAFKALACKKDETKDDKKKSGFQTNILSVALIALCTLFKYWIKDYIVTRFTSFRFSRVQISRAFHPNYEIV